MKNNTRNAYPAIFTPEQGGGYSVRFPDVDGCFTEGDSLADAIFMAEDALSLMLYEYESEGIQFPKPTNPKEWKTDPEEIISFVGADLLKYRKKFNKKAVKKTLTIPEWMNEEAVKAGINFSQLLQEALEQKLGCV